MILTKAQANMKLTEPWKTYTQRVIRFYKLPAKERSPGFGLGLDRFLREEQKKNPIGTKYMKEVEDEL